MPATAPLADVLLAPLRAVGGVTAIAAVVGRIALHALGAAALVGVLAGLRELRHAPTPAPRWRRMAAAVADVVVAVCAFGVLDSVLKNRADSLTGALGRWDHWILCALGGHLLGRLPLTWRIWSVVGVSLIFVGSYVGSPAIATTLAGALPGWAAMRFLHRRSPVVALAVQPCATLGVVAYLWLTRAPNPLPSLQAWGLACWAFMRHVSFVVEARRGHSTLLRNYLCYLLFFPSCFGAMEVYDEFAARNLRRPHRPDLVGGLVSAIRGDILVCAALLVPITHEAWLASTTFLSLWGHSLLLFLRGGLFLAGVWATIEGEALLLGFRLRPNFTGVLTAENPTRFWRSWRGTMTNWLIRYVYVPLGGNRRHRTANILAAFAASTTWHLAGVLFVVPPGWSPLALAPTVAWGATNFAGVAVHAAWRRRWPAGTWLAADAAATRAVKIALTFCFGSLTVTVLGFPVERIADFPRIACTMLGATRLCRP